jgi:hypothetical protein
VTRAERSERARRLMLPSMLSMGVPFSEDAKLSEAPAELQRLHAAWLDYVDGGELAPLRYAFNAWREAVVGAHRRGTRLFT